MTTPRILCLIACLCLPPLLDAQPRNGRFEQMSERAEARGLAEDFKGITANGEVVPNLFPLRQTGVSTAPVRVAVKAFLNTLNSEQIARTTFPIDDDEWRKWMNQHFYIRQGVSFEEMDAAQREAAFGLIAASLSANGLKLTQDIMKLNHTLGELNNNDFEQYNEWLYHITIMGEPSATEPWGWQIDGHHVIINYFVLGDQVVMSPVFVGSEPVTAESGKYKGTSILQTERAEGLAMLHALDANQQSAAILETSKPGNNNLTEAFKDNVILDYAGAPASDFSPAQKTQFLSLIQRFIENMDEGHATIRMEEIDDHLDQSYFAWIGGKTDADAFYYRIHSPVVLIEFDHQSPAGLRRHYPDRSPNLQHIHVVIRTPNGNDYGKDLLRQHHEKHPH